MHFFQNIRFFFELDESECCVGLLAKRKHKIIQKSIAIMKKVILPKYVYLATIWKRKHNAYLEYVFFLYSGFKVVFL